MISLIRTLLRHDQIVLETDTPEDLPSITCNSQQIQQVVMNLMTNARDALCDKYPEAHANKIIRLSARAFEKDGRPWLRLTVEDRGGGIPEPVRDHIFDPFFTTKPQGKGTGLGLAISYGIVKGHKGALWCESESGEWTRFHVELPGE